MPQNVIPPDQARLEKINTLLSQKRKDSFMVVSDFDQTLTKAFVNGEKIPSIISLLRTENLIDESAAAKMQNLYDIYHPIEVNFSLNAEEKGKKMEEWWTKVFGIIIDSGLTKDLLKKTAGLKKIQFREGFSEFIWTLKKLNMPLAIISSSGLGREAINYILEREEIDTQAITIVSNSFQWDENGKALSLKKPIVHASNKGLLAESFPELKEISKQRKNLLLLGDSPNDLDMADNFSYEEIVKIGFLNESDPERTAIRLKDFKKSFDFVLTNDPPLDFVTDLVKNGFSS